MKVRKKPVIVEALQWKGNNLSEMMSFMDNGTCSYNIGVNVPIKIETLEGVMECYIGDYVIKGVKDELYPCRKDIFEETYEVVESI